MCRLDGRGQADVVGVLLLTGIVVSTAGTFGVFYLTSTLEQASGATPADVTVVATDRGGTTTLTVRHTVGEPIDDGRVILRSRDETHGLPDPFVEGTTWKTPISGAPVGTRLDVLVVENATGAAVFEGRVTVRAPTPTATPAPASGPPTSTSTSTPISTPTPTPTTTPTSTSTPTATPTPTPTPRPDDPPSITSFDVTSPGKSGKVDVDWSVTDDNGLASLDVTVRQGKVVVAQESPTLSGTSASSETRFKNLDEGTYEVEIVVRDTGGSRVSEITTVTVESGGNGGGGNDDGGGNGNGNGNG
jgi:hypothetical protein